MTMPLDPGAIPYRDFIAAVEKTTVVQAVIAKKPNIMLFFHDLFTQDTMQKIKLVVNKSHDLMEGITRTPTSCHIKRRSGSKNLSWKR